MTRKRERGRRERERERERERYACHRFIFLTMNLYFLRDET